MHNALSFSRDAFSTFQFWSSFSAVLPWMLNSFSKFGSSDRMLASFPRAALVFRGPVALNIPRHPPPPLCCACWQRVLRRAILLAHDAHALSPSSQYLHREGEWTVGWTRVNHGRSNQTNNQLIYDELLAKTKCVWLQFSIPLSNSSTWILLLLMRIFQNSCSYWCVSNQICLIILF